MNQRTLSILIFLTLAVAVLTQCGNSRPEERDTTLDGVPDDRAPIAQLFAGARTGSIDQMRAAFERGADVNARNDFGWTPLMIAVFYDQENSVRWLIKRGADVNYASSTGVTAVLNAARVGDDAIVSDLIDAGGDIHAVDGSGRNALMFAVEGLRGGAVIHDLIARGFTPDLPDAQGQTALMDAAACGNVQLANILLKSGANLHAKDHAGHTPLDFAHMAHDDPMIAFLSSR